MDDLSRTILFTDIVDSTRLFDALGRREADRLRATHFAVLRDQLARHGGEEAKTLGDGMMASFGGAGRALDCAIAMQLVCSRPGGRGGEVALRIGISSGDVTLAGGDCFGIAVVEASRLCDAAAGGQVLLGEGTRLLAGAGRELIEVGPLDLKGLSHRTNAWQAVWRKGDPEPVRAVIADDATVVREGIAHVLEAGGIEVLGQAGDGPEVLRLTAELRPDLAVVDLRMPPTFTLEGLDVADRIRAEHPATAVLVLTQDPEPRHAARLFAGGRSGAGYLLKDSVTNVSEFVELARRIAAGGTAIEPSLGRIDAGTS